MLLKTKVKLELFHNLDMLNRIETMKLGGLCFVGSKRYVKANSQHMPDYDKNNSQTTSYTKNPKLHMVVACLNIYLTKDINWNNSMSIDFILKIRDDHWNGYELEVDLHCSVELHDKLKEIPPGPETLTPDIDWLTPYQQ